MGVRVDQNDGAQRNEAFLRAIREIEQLPPAPPPDPPEPNRETLVARRDEAQQTAADLQGVGGYALEAVLVQLQSAEIAILEYDRNTLEDHIDRSGVGSDAGRAMRDDVNAIDTEIAVLQDQSLRVVTDAILNTHVDGSPETAAETAAAIEQYAPLLSPEQTQTLVDRLDHEDVIADITQVMHERTMLESMFTRPWPPDWSTALFDPTEEPVDHADNIPLADALSTLIRNAGDEETAAQIAGIVYENSLPTSVAHLDGRGVDVPTEPHVPSIDFFIAMGAEANRRGDLGVANVYWRSTEIAVLEAEREYEDAQAQVLETDGEFIALMNGIGAFADDGTEAGHEANLEAMIADFQAANPEWAEDSAAAHARLEQASVQLISAANSLQGADFGELHAQSVIEREAELLPFVPAASMTASGTVLLADILARSGQGEATLLDRVNAPEIEAAMGEDVEAFQLSMADAVSRAGINMFLIEELSGNQAAADIFADGLFQNADLLGVTREGIQRSLMSIRELKPGVEPRLAPDFSPFVTETVRWKLFASRLNAAVSAAKVFGIGLSLGEGDLSEAVLGTFSLANEIQPIKEPWSKFAQRPVIKYVSRPIYVVGVVGAGTDVWAGIDAARDGDYFSAGLHGASIGATYLAVFSAGWYAAAGIAAVFAIDLALDHKAKIDASNFFESENSRIMLRAILENGGSEETEAAIHELINADAQGRPIFALFGAAYEELQARDETTETPQEFLQRIADLPPPVIKEIVELGHGVDPVDGALPLRADQVTPDGQPLAGHYVLEMGHGIYKPDGTPLLAADGTRLTLEDFDNAEERLLPGGDTRELLGLEVPNVNPESDWPQYPGFAVSPQSVDGWLAYLDTLGVDLRS